MRTFIAIAVLALAGCATLKALETDTVDCAKQDEGQLAQILPLTMEALALKDPFPVLEALAGDADEVVVCDIAAVAAAKSDGGSSQLPAAAAAYLQAKNKAVVNAPSVDLPQ